MDAQGLSEGSLRSSHRETHAIRRKPAPASFQELARKLVESCSQDLVIRQRLDAEKAEGALKRGTFYVMENEGRGDPGFLVFLPGKPAIFLQQRRGKQGSYFQGNTLRMRVSTSLGEGGGTILVATLDDVLHSLRLEDVWMWRGTSLVATQGFSRRREKLKEFVEHHWVPDARLLGGIFTSIAHPKSLDSFSQKGVGDTTHSVEFIPEAPGRRRMVLFLEAQERAASAHAGLKQHRERVAAHVVPPAAVPTPLQPPSSAMNSDTSAGAGGTRRARAVAVEKMPDVYDLYGEDGFPISRASVQQFALSKMIREQIASTPSKDVWVTARWRPEFGGYEITSLVKGG